MGHVDCGFCRARAVPLSSLSWQNQRPSPIPWCQKYGSRSIICILAESMPNLHIKLTQEKREGTHKPPPQNKGRCVVALTPYIQLLHSRIQLQKMKLSKHQLKHQDTNTLEKHLQSCILACEHLLHLTLHLVLPD
jgi:hypothetical protein